MPRGSGGKVLRWNACLIRHVYQNSREKCAFYRKELKSWEHGVESTCSAQPKNTEKQRGTEASPPKGTTERKCVARVRLQEPRAQRLYIGQSHFARSFGNLTQRN